VIDPSSYTVAHEIVDGETKLTVTFEDLLSATSNGTKLTFNRSDMIRLHYTATLNENTMIGITNPDTNAVKLEYSNNPNTEDHGFTHEVDVDVYTFGLEILKVDAMDHNKKLPNAKFILYRTISDVTTYAKANQQADGTYKVSQWVSDEAETTPLITGEDGTLLVSGVKAGGFYVKEIAAPSSYNPLEEPLEVWIQVQGDNLNNEDGSDDVIASVGNALVTVNPGDGIVSATIENASGTVLPSTGGIGTTIFYAVGGILVFAALILLVTRKRMDAEA
jgi:LPXTG-motif cell wall-anchored protein